MRLDDPARVAAEYRDSASFDARVRIYELFDVNPERWPRWLFARLGLRASDRVLEVGCGTGNLWRENAQLVPEGVSLVLTDLSAGMLDEARKRLVGLSPPPEFRAADAQSLPFPDASFDRAIASFMLYHVPDRGRALRELARVLRPGGRLFVATYPWTHLIELRELTERFGLVGAMLPVRRDAHEFDLEHAIEELAEVLPVERVERRDSTLAVTDPEIAVAFLRSSCEDAHALEPVRAHLARQIRLTGAFQIQISAGLVMALKR